MAKKTKDSEIELKTAKKVTEKKPATNKKVTTKKADSIKTDVKSTASNKTASKSKTTKKTTTDKKVSKKTTSKSVSTKKNISSKTSTSTSASSKSTGKKANARKISVSKTATGTSFRKKDAVSKDNKHVYQSEYYDLPFSYNKTVVKILAQTPTTLFVYWEVSEDDSNKLKETYGEKFFEVTKPVLILYNDTLNYSFEIEINDFANSWYIHINDSKSEYRVELGRKLIPMANIISSSLNNSIVQKPQSNYENSTSVNNESEQENLIYIPHYIYITSSNEIISPNDRVLFKKISKITFRNIKTGETRERDFKEFKFITNNGIMNLKEIYQYLFPKEDFSYEKFLRNPSSGGLTSSSSFSSQFK